MASLTYSNLSSIPGLGSSLGTALQNKINPQPLAPAKPTWQQTLSNQNLPTSYPYQVPSLSDINRQASVAAGFASPTSFPIGGMSVNTAANSNTGAMNGISQPAMATNAPPTTSQATPVSSIPPATNTSLATPTSNAGTFGGFVRGLANQANSPYNQATQGSVATSQNFANGSDTGTNTKNALQANTSLQNFAQNQTPQVANAESAYNQFAQSSPYMLAAQSNPNVAADVASGRTALLGQTFAQELAAKQQDVSNSLTGQGQQITAAGTAGDQALTGVNQQIGAAQNAGNLAQTGQNNAQSALTSGANETSPYFNGYVGIDKQTGQGINGQSLNSEIQQGVNANTYQQQAGDYQTGLKNLRTADALQPGIVSTLASNPGLNSTKISAITDLSQWLSGETSNPAQQVLSQQVANYVKALGYTPDQAAQIARQSGGTIGTLLEALRSSYEAQNNANLGSNSSQSGNANTSISSGNSIYSF